MCAVKAHWRVDIRGEMFPFIKHPRQSVRAQRDGGYTALPEGLVYCARLFVMSLSSCSSAGVMSFEK